METTSFIPKKSFSKPVYRRRSIGLFLGVAVALFFISALVLAGAYFYKNTLEKRASSLSESFKRVQSAFDPSLIVKLNDLSKRIDVVKVLLGQHKSPSKIFRFLEEKTLKNVRFSSFSYKFLKDKEPEVSMRGMAKSYSSLALQSESFQDSKNVKNVSVSEISLKDGGMINFNIHLVLEPDFIKYGVK
ncbi:MAG TPA: hypothetical protein ENG99_00780 [bacterium]|nr:hypothetical protein [bacterium]